MKLNKKGIIALALLVAIVATILAATFNTKGEVTVMLAPETAELKIDGKESMPVKSNQIISLNPGAYIFQFSRDGFANQTSRITISKGEKKTIDIVLTPQTKEAKELIDKDPRAASIIKQAQDKKNSELLAKLPITTTGFSIDSCSSIKKPSDTTRKAVCITTLASDVNDAALLYARNAGYSNDQFEILIGSKDKKLVIASQNYKVEYYGNISSAKVLLVITPMTNSTDPAQLTAIKDRALSDLQSQGYNTSDYAIFYSNSFLSQFNSEVPEHDHSEHALSPGQ